MVGFCVFGRLGGPHEGRCVFWPVRWTPWVSVLCFWAGLVAAMKVGVVCFWPVRWTP